MKKSLSLSFFLFFALEPIFALLCLKEVTWFSPQLRQYIKAGQINATV